MDKAFEVMVLVIIALSLEFFLPINSDQFAIVGFATSIIGIFIMVIIINKQPQEKKPK
jgi:hypothetical protein